MGETLLENSKMFFWNQTANYAFEIHKIHDYLEGDPVESYLYY